MHCLEKTAWASRGPRTLLWHGTQYTILLRDGHVVGARCSTGREVFSTCLRRPTALQPQRLNWNRLAEKDLDNFHSFSQKPWHRKPNPTRSLPGEQGITAIADLLETRLHVYIKAWMGWTIRCTASIKLPESLAKECAHNILVCGQVSALWHWAQWYCSAEVSVLHILQCMERQQICTVNACNTKNNFLAHIQDNF